MIVVIGVEINSKLKKNEPTSNYKAQFQQFTLEKDEMDEWSEANKRVLKTIEEIDSEETP